MSVLKLAREEAKLRQAAAAAAIQVARTTLVAIEKGQRRIRISELQQLARLYGTSVKRPSAPGSRPCRPRAPLPENDR